METILIILLIILVTFCILILVFLHKVNKKKKLELTMKVVLDAREKFKLSNNELKKEIGNKELSSLDVEEIFTSKSQIVLKIRDLLGIFENLSTSVNMGILDINYIARTSKTYFIKVFEQWKPFIDYRRNDTGNKKLYIEFQTMIEKLKKDFND